MMIIYSELVQTEIFIVVLLDCVAQFLRENGNSRYYCNGDG